MRTRQKQMNCELCMVEASHNFHHLIPRTVHSNKWFKKRYTRAQMAEGIDVCWECHKTIHRLIPSEKVLGRSYNTVELLLGHEEVAKYVLWKRVKLSNM